MALAARTPRQNEIIDAARRLLVEEGIEAVTVGRIAQALGIKAPSLYKHFAGKAEIEAALIEEGFEAHAAAMESAGDDLAKLAAAYRAFALANPQLYRLMTERPVPGLEARVAAPLIRAAADPDIARAVWGFAHGMVLLELSARFPPWAKLDRTWAKAITSFER